MNKGAGARRRPPTIHDVAREAGVSRGTVSRVLNGGHYVSPAAAEAVDAAIRRTGYVVNRHARSLITGRSDSVGFLLTEPQERFFEDPNFNVLLRGCTQALAGHDIPLLLMLAGTEDERRRITRYITAGHVDGVLLVSSHSGDPIATELREAGVPLVACGKPIGLGSKVSYVAADDRDGARDMVRHLLAQGRRRVGVVTGPLDTPAAWSGSPATARCSRRRASTTTSGSSSPVTTAGPAARRAPSGCWRRRRTSTRCSSRPT